MTNKYRIQLSDVVLSPFDRAISWSVLKGDIVVKSGLANDEKSAKQQIRGFIKSAGK